MHTVLYIVLLLAAYYLCSAHETYLTLDLVEGLERERERVCVCMCVKERERELEMIRLVFDAGP